MFSCCRADRGRCRNRCMCIVEGGIEAYRHLDRFVVDIEGVGCLWRKSTLKFAERARSHGHWHLWAKFRREALVPRFFGGSGSECLRQLWQSAMMSQLQGHEFLDRHFSVA